jgi:hypothetical protein
MVGGTILPGRPVSNMYFTLYGYRTYELTPSLLRDLKLVHFALFIALFLDTHNNFQGQYTKLPPHVTFMVQVIGGVIVSKCLCGL